jgi:hypothetical protein
MYFIVTYVRMAHIECINHDHIMNELRRNKVEKEEFVAEKVRTLLDFVRDSRYDNEWHELARIVEGRTDLTAKDVKEIRNAYKESAESIAQEKVYGVPFIWKLLPLEWRTIVSDIIDTRLRVIPKIQQKIDKRAYEITIALRKTSSIARDAAFIAYVRNGTAIHSVWTTVAKFMTKRSK